MGLADMDGFMEAFEKENMIETAKAAGGGIFGGAMYDIAVAKVKFLREGEGNMPLLKQVGTSLAMSVFFTAVFGESQESFVKGYVGGTTSRIGTALLQKFAPEALAPTLDGYGYAALNERFSSEVALNGLAATRSYSGDDAPGIAGLQRVRVSSQDPQALAAMHAIY